VNKATCIIHSLTTTHCSHCCPIQDYDADFYRRELKGVVVLLLYWVLVCYHI